MESKNPQFLLCVKWGPAFQLNSNPDPVLDPYTDFTGLFNSIFVSIVQNVLHFFAFFVNFIFLQSYFCWGVKKFG